MNPEKWALAKSLFGDLVERDASEWPALLAAEPDPEIATEVRKLLAANPSGAAFLHDSPANSLDSADSLVGRSLGPFKIVRLLGEGGGGKVYLAERSDVGGLAAIKILRGRFASSEATRRFSAEQEILARLDHPNIARLLQVGVTEDGTPWLAMEYVEGRDFGEVMATLPIRQRVQMVIRLLAAVDYAHRQLVVHRDIKPGNILVDQRGQPRLLDFGIAKRLDDANLTLTNYQPRTPAYAAPEQVVGEPITVATDVYAMGVLLYELLSGQHPWLNTGKRLDDAILAGTASLPSSRTSGADRRQLRGDLDAIVMQAMDRQPARRYPSAAAMADDLQRYLDLRPVSAQKQTLAYRSRRFLVRNHRYVVAVLLVIALFGFALQREYRLREEAALEARKAALEAEKATQVAEFMLQVFDAGDSLTPGFTINKDSTVLDLMDRGAARLSTLQAAPLARADLAHKIGQVYWGLSEYGRAEKLFQTAIELRERILGAGSETAESYLMLGRVYERTGRYDQMLESMEKSYQVRLAALGPDDPDTINSLHRLGSAYYQLQDLPRADTLVLQAIAAWRKRLPDNRLEMANSLTIHALTQLRMGGAAEALRSLEEALDLRRLELPDNHNIIAEGLTNGSRCLFDLGRTDEAIAMLRQSQTIAEANYSGDHWDIVLQNKYLARYLIAANELLAASDAAEKAVSMATRLHQQSPNPELVNLAKQSQIEVLGAQGQLQPAIDLAREVLKSRLQNLPPLHSHLIMTRSVLADLLRRSGSTSEALEQLNLALASWRQRSFGYTSELVDSMNQFADGGLCSWLDAEWPDAMPPQMEAALERSRKSCSTLH